MAKSNFNVITHGLSGLIGDMLVFRQVSNKTIVSNRPRPSEKELKPGQIRVRAQFKRAVAYAKSAMADPALKAAYQALAKPGQTASNMAFADYQKGPEFYEDVNFSTYSGAVGEKITLSVIDNYRVERVHVEIRDGEGLTLEQGDAIQSPNELDWVYTSTVVNSALANSRFIFTAFDLPGNNTVLEKVLV